MALIRNILWVAFFLAATFAFTVVFEYGFSNFGENAHKQVDWFKKVVGVEAKKPAPAAPAAGAK